jgi:Flp pilus assembly protein TadG
VTSLRGTLRRLVGDRRGATAVEFAMVAGPLMLLLFGTMEFGRLMWLRQALEETATVGARCMGIPQPECMTGTAYDQAKTRTFILSEASSWGLAVTTGDLAIDRAATCSGLPDFSTVEISYTFSSAVPILFDAIGVGPTITSQVCFPNQGS